MRRTAQRLCIAAGCLCIALPATAFASDVAASLPPHPDSKQMPLDHSSMATASAQKSFCRFIKISMARS